MIWILRRITAVSNRTDTMFQRFVRASASNFLSVAKELVTAIPHFEFLKTATLSRFPDFKPARRVSSLRTTHLPHHWTSTLEETAR